MKLHYSICAVVCLCLGHSASAQVYDAAAAFSNVNSDTSLWSYRYRPDPIRNGAYSLLQNYGPFTNWPTPPGVNLTQWSFGPTSGEVPLVAGNNSGFDLGSGPVWLTGTLLVHPGFPAIGQPSTLVAVSWLSPLNGLVNVDFRFASLDVSGDGFSWFVEMNNGANTLAMGAFAVPGDSGSLTLGNVIVNVGDRINFIVDSNADLHFDSTMLRAVVTVPEPSAMILCALVATISGPGIFGRTLKRRRL